MIISDVNQATCLMETSAGPAAFQIPALTMSPAAFTGLILSVSVRLGGEAACVMNWPRKELRVVISVMVHLLQSLSQSLWFFVSSFY